MITQLYHQHGAMFGLDARIALAIFGGLSIVIGSVLYSAILNTKVTAMITEMESVTKAIESHMVDTGVLYPRVGNAPDNDSLVSSTLPGWRGPYINAEIIASQIQLTSGTATLCGGDETVWDRCGVGQPGMCLGGGSDCFLWVVIQASPFDDAAVDLATAAAKADEIIDGGDGYDAGRLRFVDLGGGFTELALQGPQWR